MGCRSAPLILLALLGSACGRSGPEAATAEDAFRTGEALYYAGDLLGALPYLRAAVELDPWDAESRSLLAYCYREGSWEAEGYGFFRRLAASLGGQVHPLEPVAAIGYQVAAFAAYAGDSEVALAGLAEARKARPPTYREARLLSDALLVAGRPDTAIELLQRLVRRHESATLGARADLAQLLWRAGRDKEALAEAELLEREFPGEVAALAVAALARFARGELEASETLTKSWLAAAPGDPEALWNLTRIAVARGDQEAADLLLSTVVGSGS